MFACALLIAAAVPAPAPPLLQTSDEEKEFVEGLEDVHLQMERRRWAKARQEMDELLLAHRGRNYVLAREIQVREDMKRIAFHIESPAPDPAKLVAGTLEKYKENGDMELVLDGVEQLDKEMSDARPGYLSFPSGFSSNYELLLEGKTYPDDEPPQIILDAGRDYYYIVLLGIAPDREGMYQPTALRKYGEGQRDDLDEFDRPNLEAGQPWEVEVKVTSSKITVKTNGKSVVSGKREKGDHGGFTLCNIYTTWASDMKVTIDGRVETSWMQNKVDAALEEKRDAFEAGYDPAKYLPSWFLDGEVAEVEVEEEAAEAPSSGGSLRERAGAGGRTQPASREEPVMRPNLNVFPGKEPGRRDTEVWFEAFVGMQDHYSKPLQQQYDFLDQLETEGKLPSIILNWMNYRVYERAGLDEQAAEYAREVVKEDPRHLDSRIGYAEAMTRMKDPRADGIWRSIAADFPRSAEALYPVAFHFMFDNRIDEADAFVTELAKDPEVRETLKYVQRILVYARSGPAWGRRYDYQTRNYDVASDLDQEICEAAARALESAYTSYSLHLKRIDGLEGHKFRVFLFSGEEGYKRYAGEAFGGGEPESTAGLYSGLVKQLLIWNLPDREQMFRTILHEGFHQYLDQIMPDPPVWLNEGMAEYFEMQEVESGKWQEGQAHRHNLAVLERDGLIPMAQFIRLDHQTFREPEHTSRNYAQGWAFVHYLRNSTRENKKFFDEIFETFCARGGRQAVIEEVFSEVDLAEMDRALKEHVAAVRRG